MRSKTKNEAGPQTSLQGHILMIGEDTKNCELLEILSHRRGFKTFVACSQTEALMGKQAAQAELIVLNQLPDMDDSHETLTALRRATSAPILFISEAPPNDLSIQAMSLGASAVLERPFSPQVLLQQVDVLLSGGKPHPTGDPSSPNGMKHGVAVLIPAYNEERSIGSVVLKARRFAETVIVVDDGSTDDTAQVARDAGALVISHTSNLGKGAALNTAFCSVREYQPDVVVMLDADGQHNPEEIGRVIDPVVQHLADIVVGSRYIKPTSDVPRIRIAGHWVFNWITRLTSGVEVSDSQSGFRAFSPRAVEAISFHSAGFSVESEMQFIARENHLKLVEVPITITYADPSKRSVVGQGAQVLNGILHLVGQYRPLLFLGVPGFIMLLAGLILGLVVVERYEQMKVLAVGYAIFCVLLSISGLVTMTTGIMLHSIRGLLTDLLGDQKRKSD